ncbi:DUF2798 domain-containing protein [Thalassospira permensis]|uniref:DUF2798 domain-containing protein n=1 Tax=Thalassospira permensis NBRC 106175 TaxID=1353532 RepID=A0ABR4TMV2_9PROT|nr:DUF2798 domain-containing protein [Thalassospira permensis]KEO56666.1 hypothetical protein SMB34_18815 [Thalassospira permensis NBRC 106175]
MLPARFYRFVFSGLMSIWLSTLMTGLVTLINTGIDPEFLLRWGRAFVIAWPIAFSLVLISGSTVTRIANNLTRDSRVQAAE